MRLRIRIPWRRKSAILRLGISLLVTARDSFQMRKRTAAFGGVPAYVTAHGPNPGKSQTVAFLKSPLDPDPVVKT